MSTFPSHLSADLSTLLGVAVDLTQDRPQLRMQSRRVGGGDINDAYRVDTPIGPVFVKTHKRPPSPARPNQPTFFEAERRGLALLSPLPVPRVLGATADMLALEWLDAAPETQAHALSAGRALATLHQTHGRAFGLDHDNFMGTLVQDNRPAATHDFAAFFRERRLAPFLPHLPYSTRNQIEHLRLEFPPCPPTLIHGDLWAGNLMYTTRGPIFIDPAVSYGHPEQDLAMTRLFGGFSTAFYDGYRELSGLRFDDDLDRRLEVLTLYPLLVHVALFGGSYLSRVDQILRHC
jgi:fructosamine-3-kinase